jgi:hypothetical protein
VNGFLAQSGVARQGANEAMDCDVLDDLEAAIALVEIKYDASDILRDRRDPQRKHRDVPDVPGCAPLGALIPLSVDESRQLHSMRELINRYLGQRRHVRPLCLAVFGSPGSGKSFAVKQVQAEVQEQSGVRLVSATINLTQLASPVALTGALVAAMMAAHEEEGSVPIIFFDEFDTTRDGAAYGWLGSFLAPMHDGEFIHDGRTVKLKKAVYVFAGGTAQTMQEFTSRQSEPEFRRAKGPDFVSRLRGFLDVRGPNEAPRTWRRALVLRHELAERVRRHGKDKFRIDRPLIDAFLRAGRYRYGARSIAALIEIAELDQELLGWKLLPDDHLVGLHVDHGRLDPKLIGGSIALSGFGPAPEAEGADETARLIGACWTCVAKGLWNEGATLTFAGRWNDRGASALVDLLLTELSSRPQELSANESVRSHPDCSFRSFLHGQDPAQSLREANAVLAEQRRKQLGVELVAQHYLDSDENAWNDWRARTLERFRRRWAVSEDGVARFVIAGQRPPVGDRPSGVVEETIQSLALRRPVYLAGGFGGATEDLGVVLGLSGIRTGTVPDSLRDRLDPRRRELLTEIANRLRPPPFTTLPVFPDEQVAFLKQHALGGDKWPDNGLSARQNRILFGSTDCDEVKNLVVEGLGRVFSSR